MKRTLSFLSVVLFISIISFKAFPQQDSLASKNVKGVFHTGIWAIQLEESEYLGLTDTRDLTIIGMKFLSSKTAICAGVSIIGLLNDNKNSTVYKSNGTLYYTLDNSAISLNGTEIFLHYTFYPVNEKFINLYFGGGPMFIIYTKNINESGYIVQEEINDHYQISMKDKVWGVGASLILGVEWIPYKNFGITAEYGALIVASTHSNESFIQHSNTPVPDFSSSTNDLFEISFSDIKLGMLVFL